MRFITHKHVGRVTKSGEFLSDKSWDRRTAPRDPSYIGKNDMEEDKNYESMLHGGKDVMGRSLDPSKNKIGDFQGFVAFKSEEENARYYQGRFRVCHVLIYSRT